MMSLHRSWRERTAETSRDFPVTRDFH
ncbi:protein of unknown function [Streptomyces murinus]